MERYRGCGTFLPGFRILQSSQLFAPVYDSATAGTDLGIPLRTSSGIDTLSARSSVQATYDQILNDLHNAEAYLPAGLPGKTLNRPVKITAQALLARVYLSMRNYLKARASADSALQVYSTLMNYNDLPLTSPVPINMFNPETLYEASFLPFLFLSPLLSAVPAVATAPALVLVGVFMLRPVSRIQWQLPDEAIPAFLALVLIPFTYSITQGIIWGFFSWTLIKAGVGKYKEITLPLLVIDALALLSLLIE